jgi:ubiquinone/menaquinone biosynthesis C-methylase UbiE
MSSESKLTGETNGILWGQRAADWAELQEHQCQPVYEAVFARLKLGAGAAYLDAGCGAGMAAQIAASRGAQVSGCDASEALLAIARRRVPAGNFHRCDLEQMPFADGSFDLVTGFNSFQYAAHPWRALADARRVSRPGATIAIMTWGRPDGMPAAALVAALRPLLPPPPPGAPGPFALSEEQALRGFAAEAGLTPEDVFDVESPWEYHDLKTAVRALDSSGVAERARQNSGIEAVDQAHREALAPFRRPDGTYRVAATFRCLIARAGRE